MKQQFGVATQMIDAFAGNGGVAFRLCQDECALQSGLRVERKSLGGPFCPNAIKLHRFGDISFDFRSMTADTAVAGFADRGAVS